MTRPQMASCSAKPPPPSARRAPEGLDGPRCPWVAGGRQLETRTVLRRHNTRPPRTAPDHLQYKTRPARVVQPHSRYKIRPAHPSSPHARYKTRPARPKWPFLARFSRAGRTFYRFRQQEAAHGELCTEFVNKRPRWAAPGTKFAQHTPPHRRGTAGTGGPGCDARGQRRHHRPQISHAIRLEEVSTMSENVAIPTLLIHDSKESRGNCMRNF